MLVLSFLWLALVVVELSWGWSRLLEVFGTVNYGKLCFVLRWTRRRYSSGGSSRYTRHRYLASRDQAAAP